ncbi:MULTISPECIES: Na+/H+ antiporter subunit E [unclassified Thioalkalivibrio]|uniref:Na+/H+ antiporter subunit E n=1 Tax=unclassified Thioalkalivibrio TaxID=2621013 RepID=UPI0004755F3B|nr:MULTISPECIES: Na+/H+ antiporter subunit E [unclassified Thioalkalivibrio]
MTRVAKHRDATSRGGLNRARARWRRAAWTVLAAAVLWWILAGLDSLLEPLALLAVVLAGAASLVLPTGRPLAIRPRAIPGLTAYFVRASFLGGIDIARRALDPRLPIAPDFIEYRADLPHGPPLTLFMAVLSLLPGTLSVRLEGRLLTVHVLDRHSDPESALRDLEKRIHAAFEDPRQESGGDQ